MTATTLVLPFAPTAQDNVQGAQTAPAAPAGGAPPTASSPFTGMLVPLLLCAAVFYLLVLGPERKNRKKREEMLKQIGKGDKVMTTGGMYATVAGVQDDVVTLQIADGVRARFSRSAVQTVVSDDATGSKETAEKPAERETAKK